MTTINTFGDVRRTLVQTIADLRSGAMPASTGMAIAAATKVLNENVQVEINATKLALQTKDEVHNFGRIVPMGQRLINGDEPQPGLPALS